VSKRFLIWHLFQNHSLVWWPTIPSKNFTSLCMNFSNLKFWVQKNSFAKKKSLKYCSVQRFRPVSERYLQARDGKLRTQGSCTWFMYESESVRFIHSGSYKVHPGAKLKAQSLSLFSRGRCDSTEARQGGVQPYTPSINRIICGTHHRNPSTHSNSRLGKNSRHDLDLISWPKSCVMPPADLRASIGVRTM